MLRPILTLIVSLLLLQACGSEETPSPEPGTTPEASSPTVHAMARIEADGLLQKIRTLASD